MVLVERSAPAVRPGRPVFPTLGEVLGVPVTGAMTVPWVGLGAIGGFVEESIGEQTQESAEAEADFVLWSCLQSNCAEVPSGQLATHACCFCSQLVEGGEGVAAGWGSGACSGLGGLLGGLLVLLAEDEEEEEPGAAQAQLEEIAPFCSSHLKSEIALLLWHVASQAALRISHSVAADDETKIQASKKVEKTTLVTQDIFLCLF